MGKFRIFKVLAAIAIAASVAWGQGAPIPNSDLTWQVVSGILTIRGEGAMPDLSSAPWSSSRRSVTDIVIGDSVTSIGNYAFAGFENITEITIPNSVTSIGNFAFSGCHKLVDVTIPSSVTNIGNEAFANCWVLTEITIPTSVTTMGRSVFTNTNLTTLNFNAINCVTHSEAFRGPRLTTVNIGDEVTVIPENAFSYQEELTSVNIGKSVAVIGNYAFFNSGLTEIILPETVTEIGSGAFAECIGLTEIIIPNSVTTIGESAFAGCIGLTEIVIPNSVTSIESLTFSRCSNLVSVTIPNSVISIGQAAFANCVALTEITIPNSVETIGSWAFDNCVSLTEIVIPSSVTNIQVDGNGGQGIFRNCSSLVSVTLSNFIGTSMFANCVALTEVIIPETITEIGAWAFHNCISLTEINIPNSVTNIGREAFRGCVALTEITIPSSVTSIEERAFDGTSLTEVINLSSTPQNIFWNAFSNVDLANAILRVPSEAVGAYRAANVWSNFGAIAAIGTEITNITADFTDTNFLAAVYSLIGKIAPATIFNTDVKDIDTLDLQIINEVRAARNESTIPTIRNLSGIEHFVSLEYLNVSGHDLTELDLSKNVNLTYLNVDDNRIASITDIKGLDNTQIDLQEFNFGEQRPTSIRNRQSTDNRFGIIVAENPVSDFAKISVITPEQATINLRIMDNLGNVVFTETAADPYGRVSNPPLHNNAIVWNLTNTNGRFVANGTYLIVVEATGISGRRYTYSARIGVNR